MEDLQDESSKEIDPLSAKEKFHATPPPGKSFKQAEANWLNNNDEIVENIFGFNENSELVNGRAAMIGFLMLVLTELIFQGAPVTHSIFGIN